ncbi:DAK2 domain-containing protein [Saccharomonospora piscinae]|uniref:DAK2 domain-containing protein n=1 Tax=Saccharomonospora piscinae TaxID=687388 RepID=UPI001105BA25|nr:DAK2 domain-containing protein [Saccharomonospora piscinae]TLW90867.1 DAK2 domain-containing protein [Saccharomonospora piscinae]
MRALDGAAVREWADACVRDLGAARAEIDDINVYPVADSDTGSNLLHTVTAARDALAGSDPVAAGQALTVLAGAAVRAAKGNSGIILSQVLYGMARSADCARELDGPGLVAALRAADTAATGAVTRPVAGTMLSVLHAVAVALDGAPPEAGDVATLAAKAAADALARTPDQLPALAAAGVVDAGGRGLLAVLDALAATLTGTRATPVSPAPLPAPPPGPPGAWEVMYLLTSAEGDDGAASLRRALAALGDSVTVAEAGGGEYAVHVHCADIGAALEAGLNHGRPHQVRVEPLVTPGRAAEPGSTGADLAVVAVVHGDALAELVGAEGVPVLAVPTGGQPSTEDLLALVGRTAAEHVAVLPGGVRLTAAAERVTDNPVLAGRDVVVVPCASPVQVLAALAVHDRSRGAGADVVAMAEAAAATRRGEVVVATEDAITWVGRAGGGDVMGFIDGEVVLIEPPDGAGGVTRAAVGVLDRLLAVGGELVTVLLGAAAPPGVADALDAHLRAERPDVELVCYSGGQTDAVLLMGVE